MRGGAGAAASGTFRQITAGRISANLPRGPHTVSRLLRVFLQRVSFQGVSFQRVSFQATWMSIPVEPTE